MKVLIIEDNPLVGKSLTQGLGELGWTVDLAGDGEEGLYVAASSHHDAIVLDWMLPKLCGIDLLRQLRQSGRDVPIIMVSLRMPPSSLCPLPRLSSHPARGSMPSGLPCRRDALVHRRADPGS